MPITTESRLIATPPRVVILSGVHTRTGPTIAAKESGSGSLTVLADQLPPDAHALHPTVLPPLSAQHDTLRQH